MFLGKVITLTQGFVNVGGGCKRLRLTLTYLHLTFHSIPLIQIHSIYFEYYPLFVLHFFLCLGKVIALTQGFGWWL